MDKRSFLKTLAAIVGLRASNPVRGQQTVDRILNWAQNIEYSTSKRFRPGTQQQVLERVAGRVKLKALGTRHCFNRIADSKHEFIDMTTLNRVLHLDPFARTVTAEAGIRYGELSPYLEQRGFALHNLASLPHISIGGACATGTHGSGTSNGNLSTAVTAMEFVTADGEIRQLSHEKDGDTFLGSVVHLGALGIVTQVTLQVESTYKVKQYVYEQLPMVEFVRHFRDVVESGYSVSLFTDWRSDRLNELWIKQRVDSHQTLQVGGPELFGAQLATRNLHPIATLSAENCTEQMGVVGPWYDRLPHFRMGFTPSSGKELQAEYFVSLDDAVDAIRAVARLRDEIAPHLMISELRTIAADQLWMSPAYRRASLAIHFTWKQDWPSVRKVLPLIERELSPFGVRPHWGKLFTLAPRVLQSRYERLDEFRDLVQRHDPQGKFRNPFLAEKLYA